jgi:hypothetical protein
VQAILPKYFVILESLCTAQCHLFDRHDRSTRISFVIVLTIIPRSSVCCLSGACEPFSQSGRHAAFRMPLRGIDLNSLACSTILQMRCLFAKICLTFTFREDRQFREQFLKVTFSKASEAEWGT